jgi:hypothetical protein
LGPKTKEHHNRYVNNKLLKLEIFITKQIPCFCEHSNFSKNIILSLVVHSETFEKRQVESRGPKMLPVFILFLSSGAIHKTKSLHLLEDAIINSTVFAKVEIPFMHDYLLQSTV